MTKRFRMIAGPNGSGKSTLVGLLRRDYAVNFYTMLNADEKYTEYTKRFQRVEHVERVEVFNAETQRRRVRRGG